MFYLCQLTQSQSQMGNANLNFNGGIASGNVNGIMTDLNDYNHLNSNSNSNQQNVNIDDHDNNNYNGENMNDSTIVSYLFELSQL